VAPDGRRFIISPFRRKMVGCDLCIAINVITVFTVTVTVARVLITTVAVEVEVRVVVEVMVVVGRVVTVTVEMATEVEVVSGKEAETAANSGIKHSSTLIVQQKLF
jgi:hypothetical protein